MPWDRVRSGQWSVCIGVWCEERGILCLAICEYSRCPRNVCGVTYVCKAGLAAFLSLLSF